MTLVVDASVVLDFLLDLPPFSTVIASRLGRERLAAPHLLDAEVLQVLRRFVRKGACTAKDAQNAMDDLRDLPMVRYAHGPLLDGAWRWHERLTAYDALYVALAIELDSTLLTRDAALAIARPKARVEVLS